VSAAPLGDSTLSKIGEGRVEVPRYDRAGLGVGIVHFGVGGFHRAHQAMYLDRLAEQGRADGWGICGVGLLPFDAGIRDAMRAQDCLYTLVTKAPDGASSARVIGSIVDYRYAPDDPEAVLDVMTAPSTRIVSMTVTESGYNVHRVTGEFDPDGPGIAEDLSHPERPATVFGYVAEALARRRAAGTEPFAVLSCDNVQGNGDVARRAFSGYARLRDADLGDWMEQHVAFPNCMVDRITPATTEDDRAMVSERFGVSDRWPVICEPFTQWVLEDHFPAGRPPLEEAGVQVVADVEPYELMKLRLLNAGHQAIGYAGLLAGYRFADEATHDSAFADFLRGYWREEAIPSLKPVPGVDLSEYTEELIERFGNPHIRDTLARLCVDSSERMPKFVLPVLRYQLAEGGPIDRAVAIVAAWARWSAGTDELGASLEMTDPAAETLRARAAAQDDNPFAFVENRDIFGDLVDDPRFVASFEAASASLAERGARATIATLAARGSWAATSV
jgi:mannitol 2-dehydrogenase